MIPEHADRAMADADGASFQGRVLHIIKAKRPKENEEKTILDKKSNSKLSSYQQKREEERKKLAGKKDGSTN